MGREWGRWRWVWDEKEERGKEGCLAVVQRMTGSGLGVLSLCLLKVNFVHSLTRGAGSKMEMQKAKGPQSNVNVLCSTVFQFKVNFCTILFCLIILSLFTSCYYKIIPI